MTNKKRLIEELREMADRTPPICQYDKPYNTEIFGKEITVYCKPFEQFQDLLKRAADALSVDAVEVVHGKWEYGRWEKGHWVKGNERCRCSVCHRDFAVDNLNIWNGCPHCLAKMDGKERRLDFCSYGERKDSVPSST